MKRFLHCASQSDTFQTFQSQVGKWLSKYLSKMMGDIEWINLNVLIEKNIKKLHKRLHFFCSHICEHKKYFQESKLDQTDKEALDTFRHDVMEFQYVHKLFPPLLQFAEKIGQTCDSKVPDKDYYDISSMQYADEAFNESMFRFAELLCRELSYEVD